MSECAVKSEGIMRNLEANSLSTCKRRKSVMLNLSKAPNHETYFSVDAEEIGNVTKHKQSCWRLKLNLRSTMSTSL